jgi:hypothetical protein
VKESWRFLDHDFGNYVNEKESHGPNVPKQRQREEQRRKVSPDQVEELH